MLGTEERYPLTFSDEEEWWAWMWSHGTRSLLEAVPGAQLEALKRALARELGHCRGDDGRIHGDLAAHVLVAVNPSAKERPPVTDPSSDRGPI